MTLSPEALQQTAHDHLWLHFSRLAPGGDGITVIERGEGCYVWDSNGKRYLDGLAGLFVVQVGHGRPRDGRGRGRARPSSSPTSRSGRYAHPTGHRAGRPPGRRWRPATSTGCSSPPAAARRSSRPGSWPAQYFLADRPARAATR